MIATRRHVPNASAGTCKTCQVQGNSICESAEAHQKDWRLTRRVKISCTIEVYEAEGWLIKRYWFHVRKGGGGRSVVCCKRHLSVGHSETWGVAGFESMHGLEITRMSQTVRPVGDCS